MKIALYFGSFNPVHVGHLVIANYIATHHDIDQVWMVVSPHNPHKDKKGLLEDYHRLALVKVAVDNNPVLRASDIEFSLEQPNYTAKTLAHLKEKYPTNEFSLIIGEDNLRSFHKWYNFETILNNHKLFVYPRVTTIQEKEQANLENNDLQSHPAFIFCKDAPVMDISSSYIRNCVKNGHDIRYLVTPEVFNYIDEMGFYRK